MIFIPYVRGFIDWMKATGVCTTQWGKIIIMLKLDPYLRDYPRGIVVNSKTYPIYKMWQKWLISLNPQEATYLSPLDEEARDLLMPPSTIAVEQKEGQKEEMKEDLEKSKGKRRKICSDFS